MKYTQELLGLHLGEGESQGQAANPGSTGKTPVTILCVCGCVLGGMTLRYYKYVCVQWWLQVK